MRDYARKSMDAPSSRHKEQWFSNLMLILTIIFLICAACQFTQEHLGFLFKKPTWLSTKNAETAAQPINAPQKPLKNAAKPANTPPRYDFYKLLPEMTVNVTPTEDNNNH